MLCICVRAINLRIKCKHILFGGYAEHSQKISRNFHFPFSKRPLKIRIRIRR